MPLKERDFNPVHQSVVVPFGQTVQVTHNLVNNIHLTLVNSASIPPWQNLQFKLGGNGTILEPVEKTADGFFLHLQDYAWKDTYLINNQVFGDVTFVLTVWDDTLTILNVIHVP